MKKLKVFIAFCAMVLLAGQIFAAEGETEHIISAYPIEPSFGTMHFNGSGDVGFTKLGILDISYTGITPAGFTWRVQGALGPTLLSRWPVEYYGKEVSWPLLNLALEWGIGYTPVKSEKNTLSIILSSQIDWYFGLDWGIATNRYYYEYTYEDSHTSSKEARLPGSRYITTFSIGPDVVFTHRFGEHWGITLSAAMRYTVAGNLGGKYKTNPSITNGVSSIGEISDDDEDNITVYASDPISGGFSFTPKIGLCWRW